MMELKQKVNGIIKKNNQDWVDTIKNADEEGIDLGIMIAKNAQSTEDLDKAFMEYSERISKTGKKPGFFGGN